MCKYLSVCVELDLVHSAIYTEPKDSSAWLYYDWLINRHARLRTRMVGRTLHLTFSMPVRRNFKQNGVMMSKNGENECLKDLFVSNVLTNQQRYSADWTMELSQSVSRIVFPDGYFLTGHFSPVNELAIEIDGGKIRQTSSQSLTVNFDFEKEVIMELIDEEPNCASNTPLSISLFDS